jgi:hypothetical protein
MKILRLNNGDMIAGEVSELDGITTVKNPLFIVTTGKGAVFVDIVGMVSPDDKLQFKTEQVFTTINPSLEVEEQYSKVFSTIEVPSSKLVF